MSQEQGLKGDGVNKPPGKPPAVRTKLAQKTKRLVLKTALPSVEAQGKAIRNNGPQVSPSRTQPESRQETMAIPEPTKDPGKPKLQPPAQKTITSSKAPPTLLGGTNAGGADGEKTASMLGDYKLLKKGGHGDGLQGEQSR